MITIIGGGMAGLLCGVLNPGSTIYEAGPGMTIPQENHQAVFRCKTGQVGKILGIPFKKVQVNKSIWLEDREVQPSPRIINMYSYKVSSKFTNRSIFNIDCAERYIPPNNFMQQLRIRCDIEYNSRFTYNDIATELNNGNDVISTIPMPNMINIMGMNKDNRLTSFTADTIFVNKILLANCDTYCTVYYPDPNMSVYRASITGDVLITEGTEPLNDNDIEQIFESIGIYDFCYKKQILKNHKQYPGKISSIDNKIRKNIITELTIKHGIYSLGRFATWRPKVMLDDVLDDIFHIRRMIQEGDYAALKHQQSDA